MDRREALRQLFQPRIVPATVAAPPAVVQAAREDSTPASGEAAPAGAEQDAQEPDIEALARDVYNILRRRLQVERERDLGRS
jgi:hypothetical protein